MRQRLREPATKDSRLRENLKPYERKQVKEIIRSEISAEVLRWVIEQPPELYGQLPQSSGKDPFFFLTRSQRELIRSSSS